MSKKRANLQPANKFVIAGLFDIADFPLEAIDVAFVQFDAVLKRSQTLFHAGVIGLGTEAHVLLCRQLFFGDIQLLLLLRKFLLKNFASTGITLLLRFTINARKICRLRLSLLGALRRRWHRIGRFEIQRFAAFDV